MPSTKGSLSRLSLFLIFIHAAEGAILLYEPFDYATGNLAGKGGSEIGFDPGAKWSENSQQLTTIASGSLTFGAFGTSGNHFHYASGGTDPDRYATRAMNAMAGVGNDLFITFLMQGPTGVLYNGGSYINGSVDREFGALRSQYNVATAGVDGVDARPTIFYGNESAGNTTPDIATATTYMYVQMYTGLGTPSGGTAKLWVITASDYNLIAADGIATLAELDANSAYASNEVTLASTAPTLDGTETLRLHFFDNGSSSPSHNLDEIRIATTLNEAVIVVPEPSGFALIGLGALGLLLRRER